MAVKNREGYLGADVPLEKQGGPTPYRAPQPRASVPGRGVLIISGCENQQRFYMGDTEGCCRSRHLLKGPKHRLKSFTNTPLSSSKGTEAQKVPGHIGRNCIV